MTKSAIYCGHANEVPQSCPCPKDCYCKEHTCRCKTCGGSHEIEDDATGALGYIIKKPCPDCEAPLTPGLRVAFCGASGTGKTTLSKYLIETRGLDFNPVGSRSVSKAMGFDSPYDVDKAGKRAEFQRRLVTEKRAWESTHDSFVSDRTTLDNLAYTMFHDISAIDASLLDSIVEGLKRYTHVVYCPVSAFCNPNGDTNRVQDMTYHQLYDVVIAGLMKRYLPKTTKFGILDSPLASVRREWLDGFLAGT